MLAALKVEMWVVQ
jgi:primosomal protein N''